MVQLDLLAPRAAEDRVLARRVHRVLMAVMVSMAFPVFRVHQVPLELRVRQGHPALMVRTVSTGELVPLVLLALQVHPELLAPWDHQV